MKRFFIALCLVALSLRAVAQTPAPLAKPTATATSRPAPTPTGTPRPASKTLSSAAYRALLQSALGAFKAGEKRRTFDARKALAPLDAPFVVKRGDGQSQTVNGDEWDQILSGVTGFDAAKLSKSQTRAIEAQLQAHLKALDEWTGSPPYVAFDGQKVVDEAIASGQIRVAPPPAQQWISNVNASIERAIDNFFKWLASLLPKPKAPSSIVKMPNLSWLWFVFWAIMLTLLGLLLFLAARALSGGSFSLWGIGRRRKKGVEELRDEDAALFQLAPDELRDRADAFASSGNFREALRHRFISVLVLLDARGTWRYDIRRTNWEHIAQLRRDEAKRPLVAPLVGLTRAFDRVRYGGAPCDEDGWNEFQVGVREVESLVGGRAQRLEAIQ